MKIARLLVVVPVVLIVACSDATGPGRADEATVVSPLFGGASGPVYGKTTLGSGLSTPEDSTKTTGSQS